MATNEVKSTNAITVQFVVGSNGEPSAVLVDIDTWNHIIEKLKAAEAAHEVEPATNKMDPTNWDLEKAGYRTWQSIREEMHEQLMREEEEVLKVIDQDQDINVGRGC